MDEELKKKIAQAKKMGYSDAEIQATIKAKQQQDAARQKQTQAQQRMTVDNAVQKPQDGIVKNIARAVVKPGVDAAKLVLGTGFEVARAADSALGNKDAYDVQKGKKNPFVSREEFAKDYSTPTDTAINVSKKAAAAATYFVPMGKAASVAGKIAQGAKTGTTVGGMTGFSQSDSKDLEGLAIDTAVGAGTGTLIGGGVAAAGQALTKGARAGAENVANKLFEEPTKKGTRVAIKSGNKLGADVLDNGGAKGVTSTGIFNNAVTKIDGLEDHLQVLLKDSKRVIPIADIRKVIDSLVQKYRAAGLAGDAQMMTSQIDELEKFHGKAIPVDVANEVKRTLYDKVRNGYGELSTESKEGYKAIARALKEGIASKVKGVDVANKELRRTGRIADSMLEKMTKAERGKALSLTDYALGAGGFAAGGVPGLAAVGVKKAIETTAGKKTVMNTLNGVSKVAGVVGNIPGVASNAPKVATMAGMGVGDALSTPYQADGANNQSNEPGDSDSANKLNHTISDNSTVDGESQVVFTSPDGQWQEKSDGKIYSMDSLWVWDDASQDWIGNEAANQIDYADEDTVVKMMQDDLATTGGKNIPELEKMYKIAQDGAGGKEKKTKDQIVRDELSYSVDRAVELLATNPKMGIIAAPLEDLKAIWNKGDQATVTFNRSISEIMASIAKMRGGTAFTPNEQKLLEQYTPKVGDSQQMITTKLSELQRKLQEFSGVEVQQGIDINNATQLQY